jgi:hypothetical protein
MKASIVISLIAIIATSASAAPKHKHRTPPKPAPAASPAPKSGYHGDSGSHALQSKNEDGTQITLDDHSVWTVDDGDAGYSSTWDSKAKLSIARTDNAVNPFTITNETTGDQVHAQFSGYGATTASNTP